MRSRIAASLTILIAGGCSAPRTNPSFAVTTTDARADLKRMSDAPIQPPRPIVIVGGYSDPGFVAADLAGRLRRILQPGAAIIPVDVGLSFSMEGARDRLLARVEEALDCEGKDCTPEVDVVAVSMGGLVARYAAVPREDGPRLKIARLFTISSPHRGARLAALPTLESRVVDMRAGSPFLCRLDDPNCTTGFELIPYGRLNDAIVGAENTAPPGRTPWWVDTPALQPSHLFGHSDPRILADIARRIRGEEPFTHDPPAPLPGS
jgi:pimeloyl-ACP methyl ester carboxylesterase